MSINRASLVILQQSVQNLSLNQRISPGSVLETISSFQSKHKQVCVCVECGHAHVSAIVFTYKRPAAGMWATTQLVTSPHGKQWWHRNTDNLLQRGAWGCQVCLADSTWRPNVTSVTNSSEIGVKDMWKHRRVSSQELFRVKNAAAVRFAN